MITLISRLSITPGHAIVLYHTHAARKHSWCIPHAVVPITGLQAFYERAACC